MNWELYGVAGRRFLWKPLPLPGYSRFFILESGSPSQGDMVRLSGNGEAGMHVSSGQVGPITNRIVIPDPSRSLVGLPSRWLPGLGRMHGSGTGSSRARKREHGNGGGGH